MPFSVNRLREARGQAGLSQMKLAAAIGMDRQTVAKWEGGDSVPQANVLEKIAQVTGLPIEFFFVEKPEIAAADHKAA